jgi:hypothetical protein
VSFAAITLCVDSQRVFIDIYFVIYSVRKLVNTPSYNNNNNDETIIKIMLIIVILITIIMIMTVMMMMI